MSSDTFYLFCAPPDGDRVRLCVIPSPAGSADSCCYTRSFVLMALVDALDSEDGRRRVFPFVADPSWTGDAWMRKHVKEYVTSTDSAHDLNGVPVKGPDKGYVKTWKAIAKKREKLSGGGDNWAPIRDAIHALRHYWIDVVVADPKFIAHLAPGKLWGTTAYDSWPTDQASKRSSLKNGTFGRPSAQFAAASPEYVYPPGLVAPGVAVASAKAPEAPPPLGGKRAEKLKALIPGHRVKNVAKVLDLKPLNRTNDLLIADIVAATADPAMIDAKTASRLMRAANQPKKTKKDFLEAFGLAFVKSE